MAKRKRARGGGRKARGEFSELTSPLSFRMPAWMWKELQAAKRKSGRSTTQEVLWHLRNSFNESHRKARDPALQAVLYLIAEAAEGVTNPYPLRVANTRPLWRSNPFLFRAFKLTVGKVLGALEPAGEIKSPAGLEIADGVELLTAPNFARGIYKTPEALADFVTACIMQALINPILIKPPMSKWDADIDYGIEDARRDLGVKKPKGEKS
jgi:hypothetical protein